MYIRDANLDRKVSPVHVITEEQVSSCGRWSSYFKELHKIIELTVYVSTHSHRSLNVEHGGLVAKDGCTFIDDAQGNVFVESALEDEVLAEKVLTGSIAVVKHVSHCESLGRRQWYSGDHALGHLHFTFLGSHISVGYSERDRVQMGVMVVGVLIVSGVVSVLAGY